MWNYNKEFLGVCEKEREQAQYECFNKEEYNSFGSCLANLHL
jgi:hypothetical protein